MKLNKMKKFINLIPYILIVVAGVVAIAISGKYLYGYLNVQKTEHGVEEENNLKRNPGYITIDYGDISEEEVLNFIKENHLENASESEIQERLQERGFLDPVIKAMRKFVKINSTKPINLPEFKIYDYHFDGCWPDYEEIHYLEFLEDLPADFDKQLSDAGWERMTDDNGDVYYQLWVWKIDNGEGGDYQCFEIYVDKNKASFRNVKS